MNEAFCFSVTLDKPLDKRQHYGTLDEWVLLSYRKLFSCERDAGVVNIWLAEITFQAFAGLHQLTRSKFWKEQKRRELQITTIVEVSGSAQESGSDYLCFP